MDHTIDNSIEPLPGPMCSTGDSEPFIAHDFQGHLPADHTEEAYFRDDPPPARPQNVNLRGLAPLLNSRRRAATHHVAIIGAGTTWLDNDQSGTYDPIKDRVTPVQPRPRRQAKIKQYDSDGNTISPPRPRRSTRRGPGRGYREILKLSFASQKALEYLESISPGPYESRSTSRDVNLSDSLNLDTDGEARPVIEQRRRVRKSKKVRVAIERCDGLTLDTLTTGHPQRRGCKACFESGFDDCSLIEDGHDYPCEACADLGDHCELIIPPELKRSCEHCRQKRISCSFRIDGGKGVSTCESCAEADVDCYAGPLRGALRHTDGEVAKEVPPRRKWVACKQCREGRLRCNLKRDQTGPCSQCRKRGDTCQFVFIPPPRPVPITPPNKSQRANRSSKKTLEDSNYIRHECDVEHSPGNQGGRLESILLAEVAHHSFFKKKPQTLHNEAERARRHTAKKEQRRSAKHRAYGPLSEVGDFSPESKPLGMTHGLRHTRITTPFSHPIWFNYVPDSRGQNPCSWCNSILFGLYGYDDLEVEVIPFPAETGHGYEEVGLVGHALAGQDPTRMCVDCTFERITIMSCGYHVYEPIKVDARMNSTREVERSVQALIDGDEDSGGWVRDAKWCAICPHAAHFRCCARQEKEDMRGRGCGLYLCTTCIELSGKLARRGEPAQGLMDRTIHYAKGNKYNYEEGIRADASFLTSKGELAVRLDKGFGSDKKKDPTPDSGESENESTISRRMRTDFERVSKGKGNWNQKQKSLLFNHDQMVKRENFQPQMRAALGIPMPMEDGERGGGSSKSAFNGSLYQQSRQQNKNIRHRPHSHHGNFSINTPASKQTPRASSVRVGAAAAPEVDSDDEVSFRSAKRAQTLNHSLQLSPTSVLPFNINNPYVSNVGKNFILGCTMPHISHLQTSGDSALPYLERPFQGGSHASPPQGKYSRRSHTATGHHRHGRSVHFSSLQSLPLSITMVKEGEPEQNDICASCSVTSSKPLIVSGDCGEVVYCSKTCEKNHANVQKKSWRPAASGISHAQNGIGRGDEIDEPHQGNQATGKRRKTRASAPPPPEHQKPSKATRPKLLPPFGSMDESVRSGAERGFGGAFSTKSQQRMKAPSLTKGRGGKGKGKTKPKASQIFVISDTESEA